MINSLVYPMVYKVFDFMLVPFALYEPPFSTGLQMQSHLSTSQYFFGKRKANTKNLFLKDKLTRVPGWPRNNIKKATIGPL
jgi:hypothetical protein